MQDHMRAELPLTVLRTTISAQRPSAGLTTIPIAAFNMPQPTTAILCNQQASEPQ